MNLIEFIKQGNVSSGYATIGNIILATIKIIAAIFSGSGAMFAEAMHTLADAINQGFVFTGSILALKKPTQRFPTGFGRLINIFCMVAVIVVTIMAYETIREGWHLINHPSEILNLWLSIGVLIISISMDGYILIKAMKEIIRESHTHDQGNFVTAVFRGIKQASPPTRLVFYEDLVATSGAGLAIVAILIAHYTSIKVADGIAAMIIGLMLFGAAFKVGYDNMIGLIGVAAPKEVEDRIAKLILEDPDVRDINKMRIVQEGRHYHIESYIELRQGLSLASAANIKFRIRDNLLLDPDVNDVTLGVIEDDKVQDWFPV